jgi:hypothetical protein
MFVFFFCISCHRKKNCFIFYAVEIMYFEVYANVFRRMSLIRLTNDYAFCIGKAGG